MRTGRSRTPPDVPDPLLTGQQLSEEPPQALGGRESLTTTRWGIRVCSLLRSRGLTVGDLRVRAKEVLVLPQGRENVVGRRRPSRWAARRCAGATLPCRATTRPRRRGDP